MDDNNKRQRSLSQMPANGTSIGNQKLPLDQIIFRLTSDDQSLTLSDLYALSDLSRYDARLVREHWLDIPTSRRRWLLDRLTEAAMDDLQLQLGRLLRIALNDDDSHIRERAIWGLWEETEGELIAQYIRILQKDDHIGVRKAIARALGNSVLLGELDEIDPSTAVRAEETLLTLVTDPSESLFVRSVALESIAYSGEAGIRQLLEDAYYSPTEEMRVSALIGMGRSADIRWRSLVRAELQNPSAQMRAEAARACGELGNRAATDDLILLLEDDHPEVRHAAIFALGRLGGRDATEALRILANGGDERELAENALEEMSFYADADGAALFDETLDLDDDWDEDPWDDWLGSDEEDLGIYE